jgi:Holliday junction resolvase RusA-like endonuclease
MVECRGRLFTGPVRVTLHVYRPRRRGELDNIQKVLLDSLTGVVYRDDEQIAELHAYRHEDKQKPRVEVTVEAIEGGEE